MSRCRKVVIYGVGLIGGSLAAALKENQFADEIVGAGRTPANLHKALELGCIDRAASEFEAELADADIVVAATPVMAVKNVFEAIANTGANHCIVTDAASVKGRVVEFAEAAFGADFPNFVPAHPIAGREHSGVTAAVASLYQGKRTILTPLPHTDPEAVERVTNMWQAAGSAVTQMTVANHDDLLAASSHLPHLVAFALVSYIAGHSRSQECFDLAASGFYDFTRIASSDPVMWHDICMTNSTAVADELEGYVRQLESLIEMVRERQSHHLMSALESAKAARDTNLENWLKTALRQ